MYIVSEDKWQQIIVQGDTKTLVDEAQVLARAMVSENLKSTQFRAIFGMLRKVESSWLNNPDLAYRKLQMLKPKITYQAARNTEVKILALNFVNAIDWVENHLDRFQNFMDFAEANLGYYIAESKGR